MLEAVGGCDCKNGGILAGVHRNPPVGVTVPVCIIFECLVAPRFVRAGGALRRLLSVPEGQGHAGTAGALPSGPSGALGHAAPRGGQPSVPSPESLELFEDGGRHGTLGPGPH